MRGGSPLGESMYRVGELARATGVNPRTVDYYTRIGLLQPESRTETRYRLYAEASVQRIKTIQQLRAQRYSLDQIRSILDGQRENVVAEAARLQVELDHILGTIDELKGTPLDSKARAILNALAAKGMAVAQHVLLILCQEDIPPL